MYIRIPFPERSASSFLYPPPPPQVWEDAARGGGEEEARRNLNVSSFWLQFVEGRLGPRGRGRFNFEISVDATAPRKPRDGQGRLGGLGCGNTALLFPDIYLQGGFGDSAPTRVLRIGFISPASSAQPAPISGRSWVPLTVVSTKIPSFLHS